VRIAFAHNLQRSHSEREAEFDTPETVAAITEALRRLGHEVQPVEVSGSLSWLAARLQSLSPDFVFNTAEGDCGRFREAFFPALYEKLGLPFTGSDAHVCALTMDKRLAKNLVAAQGVPTPDSWFVEHGDGLDEVEQFPFPLIVKPNFEGSSKGIGTDSVVENRASLNRRVAQMLARFPEGVLVERFIPGRDLTVPFLEKASPRTGGVLEPACYEYDSRFASHSKNDLYDLERKTTAASAVRVMVPAPITPGQRARCLELALKVFRILGLRDLGRADFRIGDDGEIHFLEVNALPSLEPGASIYLSSAMAGLSSVDAVVEAVVRSAAARHVLPFCARPARQITQELRVGLAFNLRRADALNAEQDAEAEYDSPQTVVSIREALESYGHTVVELEATAELPATVAAAGVDVVFNIAEGIGGRFREAEVPALLELLGIPYTGSDPTAMSLTLDKQLAKLVVKQGGLQDARSHGHALLPGKLGRGPRVSPHRQAPGTGQLHGHRLDEHCGNRGRAPPDSARDRGQIRPGRAGRELPARTRVHARATG
jgi:D-alanine-D-alanine ligase